ncbi:MAG TPA: amidase [Terriglobia bacterium]|nr:amidase [Terriglobia bacterium]
MTFGQIARALRCREFTATELTRATLDRIKKSNSRLCSFITILEETAVAQAKRADAELTRGIDRGQLHGVPVAVKDLFFTQGVPTTSGSRIFSTHIPDHDATVVEKLAEAGAVLVGKTNMHELAYGITSSNPHFGTVRNPWDLERIPGGSSGGSGCAVAAGLVPIAMGSDTGGSIRIPASFCGVVGLKPTYGRISRSGSMPLSFTLDHMGPLACSVRDAAMTLNVLAGIDKRDPSSSSRPVVDYLPGEHVSIQGLRIGLPENFYFDRIHPEVDLAVRRMAACAESLGAQIVSVRVPDIGAINTVARIILLAEASAVMQPYLERRSDIGSDVRRLLDQGCLLPATDYLDAQRLRRVMRQEFETVWKGVNCLFTPTTPTSAPKIGQATLEFNGTEEDTRIATTRLVRAVNALGFPALSIPCGRDTLGLPMGLQIIGPAFQEELILRVGAALEDASGLGPWPEIDEKQSPGVNLT